MFSFNRRETCHQYHRQSIVQRSQNVCPGQENISGHQKCAGIQLQTPRKTAEP